MCTIWKNVVWFPTCAEHVLAWQWVLRSYSSLGTLCSCYRLTKKKAEKHSLCFSQTLFIKFWTCACIVGYSWIVPIIPSTWTLWGVPPHLAERPNSMRCQVIEDKMTWMKSWCGVPNSWAMALGTPTGHSRNKRSHWFQPGLLMINLFSNSSFWLFESIVDSTVGKWHQQAHQQALKQSI